MVERRDSFGFGSGDTAVLGPLVKVDKKVLISASYAGDIATPEAINKSIPVPEVGVAPAFVEGTSNVAKTSDGYPYKLSPAPTTQRPSESACITSP